MRFARLLPCLALMISACGPLRRPMFDRLPPGAQAQVDTAWNNMLAPPQRLDRDTLLGVIVERQLFQAGITRGSFHAEKAIATGTVVMEIAFDQANPAGDRFELRVYDLAWQLQRAETFGREDVLMAEQRLREMHVHLALPQTQPVTRPAVQVPNPEVPAPRSPEALAEQTARHEAALAYRRRLDAATQPAKPAQR